MVYQIKFKEKARKEFNKLDKVIQLRIINYLNKVAESGTPTAFGKGLEEDLVGLWSYRVADKYRVVVEIQDDKLIICIVAVGKRETIYDETKKRLK